MARLSTVLGAAAFLLLQVATCDNIIIARLDDLSGSPRPDGSIIDRAIRDEGVAEWANIVPRENGLVPGEVAVVGDKKYIASQGVNQAAQLDGRALLAEWMQPRGLSKRACVNAGWQSCNNGYCCAQADFCCPGSIYCKRVGTDTCCGNMGTCSAGYVCNTLCQCVETGGTCCPNGRYCVAGQKCCALGGCAPVGGECCSNGRICDTGNICVVNVRTGQYGCCTDLKCTAYVSSGTTVGLGPTPIPTNIITTPPPTGTPVTVTQYQYYYWTITWYYYSYFFTYQAFLQESTLSSTYITKWTTISVYETATAAASLSLSSLSSSLAANVLTTPPAATSALALSTNVILPSDTNSIAAPSSTSTPTTTAPVGGNATPTTNRLSAGNIRASAPNGGLIWALAAGAAACGFLMVWL